MKEVSYITRNPMAPRDAWDSLSIADKAAMMRVAVQNGVTNLSEIRQKYNEFAEGGNLYAGTPTDNDLVDFLIKEEGFLPHPKDIGDGMITLGSGLTNKKWIDLYKKRGNKWSATDNRMAVAEEVADRRKWAEKNIPNWDTPPPSSQKALLSYKYNYNFTKANSPKLFKALSDSNLQEAARQMDATSKDPKFKKGLMERRRREQQWFLSDVTPQPVQPVQIPAITEQPVSTAVVNPFILPAEHTTLLPQVAPVEDNYVQIQEITPEQQRAEQVKNSFDFINSYNRMMDLINIQNNPQPVYKPKNAPYVVMGLGGPIVETAMNEYKKGGGIHIKKSHRDRLTELKKRTGKTESELYNDGNPAHKKMVVFARNARKWKHGFGGNLYDGTTEDSQQMITTHKPYYDRDGLLLYNRTLPETIIIPDSQLSPAERNYRERQRQKNLSDYAEHKNREITAKQIVQAQKEWENSFEKQALDYGQAIASGVGMGADIVSRLPIYSSLKGASTLSRAETPMDYVESSLWLAPIVGTVGKTAYNAAKPVVSKAANEAAIAWTLRNPEVPEGYLTTKPQVRTRVGDVEIDNPNLLYHLDRGDGAGAFSTQGAYIEDGFLFPGTPRDASATPYSWWNKGKPYATAIHGQPMTRLMTTTENAPGMLHVRSQNYPIGQWNGTRGLVTNTEYVNPEGVDVSNNTYNWIEGYGWKKNIPDFSVSMEEGIAEAQANPTEKLLKWLHKPLSRKVKEPVTSIDLERLENLRDAYGIKKYPGLVKMMKEWENEGVDLSKIGKEDLDKIYQQRWTALIRDASRPRRYTLIEPEGNGYNMTDYLGLRPVGDAVLNVHDTGNLYIGNIHNKTRFDANPVKGVFERGLNAAINTAHSEGREGIITGEQFLSAPKQIPVVERNPYRIKLEGRGYHQNAKMVDDYRAVHKPKVNIFEDNERYVYNIDDMLKAGNQQYTVFPNAPAWFLPKPSRHVPTKSRTFSTHSIDRFGNMIIDWNNPYVFNTSVS